MKFQIKEVKKAVEFIELIKLIKTLSQHLTCMCTSDQIYIQIMDSSHVCLVDLIIPNTWFYIYESNNFTFSVSANILTKVCAMYTLDSVIEFIIDDENPDKLDIHIMHKLQNKMFSINLMDIERDILSTKDLDTKLDFQVNTKVLEKYVTELATELPARSTI
jgi:DNA polymerase III sliding clamp (beta) subunit (PCNA family)